VRQVNYKIKGLISVMLSLGLLLAAYAPLQATAPISGYTHSFGSSGNVQNTSNAMLTLALADLDNDGYADGVYGDGSDLKIVENDGSPFDGWPAADTVGTAGNTISGVDAADFDFDGRVDLVSVTQGVGSNEVKLWQNPSAPFTSAWTTSHTLTNTLAFNVTCAATGDLDNDGAIDVVVAGDNGTILIWRNPLTTPFTTSWGSPVTVGTGGAGIEDLVLADLDGDGALDIITGSQNAAYEFVAWENDGTPFSGPWPQHDIGATSNDRDIRALAAGDLDSDGDVDVATGLAGPPWLVVWQNDGSPFNDVWNPTNVDSSSPTAAVNDVVLADLDLDGDLDLAGGYSTSIRSWQNDGSPFDGGWVPQPVIGTAGNTVNALAAGDLDNDGDIDLVSGSESASYEILAWRNTLIHRNVPDTQYYTGTSVGSSSSNVGEVAMADLDGDGDLDMVSGNAAGVLTIWQNSGAPFSGTWPAHLDLGTTYGISALAVGDIDGDGDLDIVTGETGAAPRLRIWWNDGTPFDGGWGVPSIVDDPYTEPVAALALGDLDHDGDLDIVSGSGQDTAKIIAWRNDGTGWIRNTVYTLTYPIGANTYATTVNALALGDLDNDGDLDIVTGTDRAMAMGTIDNPVDPSEWTDLYQLRAYENDGITTFSSTWPQTNVGRDKEEITLSDPARYHGFWGATVYSVDLADFDLDGDLDIVSGDHLEADYMVKVWRNDGTPFSAEQEWDSAAVAIDAPWLDSSVWSVKAVDYDLDGDPDIVSGSGESERQVVTWENNGQPFQHLIPDDTTPAQTTWIRHNVGSCDPTNRDVLSVAVGDLDNDGDPDVGGGSGLFYSPQSPYGVNVWRNQGGSVTEVVDPAVSPPDTLMLTEDNSYELLAITATHNGIAGDNGIELKEWRLLFEETTGDPLTSGEANALIDTLWIYRDTGDGIWQITDTMVLTVSDFSSLTDGVQTLSFGDGAAGVQINPTASATFYVVARIASEAGGANPHAFQITFDPDADSIVEDSVEDTSVSIQDSEPTTAGTFIAVGPPHHVSVEYADDGTGGEVLTTTVLSGYSILSYSITRDRHENFVSNDLAYWSLIEVTGGVAEDTDLYPYWAQDQGKVVTFTGHLTGTAKIRALMQLAEEDIDGTSGTITVEQGHVWIEDKADGAGSEVITDTLLVGEGLTVYAVGRYDSGDFFSTVPVTWTMSTTGDILPTDLVPAPDGKSATFTPSVTGTVQIFADHATMVDDATGIITVSPSQGSKVYLPIVVKAYR
jgi:hypothetical protein